MGRKEGEDFEKKGVLREERASKDRSTDVFFQSQTHPQQRRADLLEAVLHSLVIGGTVPCADAREGAPDGLPELVENLHHLFLRSNDFFLEKGKGGRGGVFGAR